jgi:Na+/H+ antiporter NhaD/arsenite permease-like protein/uncharacterized membrane protein (UPF0127 family)
MITALVIFIITYVFVGLTHIPRVHVNRPAGALVGAVLMVITGVLTLDQAFGAIDMHTLLLLLGMMIITVYLRTAGFFELMAERILSVARTPLQLLVLVSLASAVLSALFVNDTICLLFTPVLLEVAAQLGVNPVPYLLALATASNIGSVMTVTGNPQNMLIGIASGISYLGFLRALAPVAAIGLLVSIAVIRLLYRREITTTPFPARPTLPRHPVKKALLVKSLLVSAGVLLFFSLGRPYSLVAVAGAVALLLIGRESTERVLEGVDWTLLLFFAGLFIVMHGVEVSGLAGLVIRQAGDLSQAPSLGRIAGLSLIAAVLSNIVSNVPAVMLLRPLVDSLGGDRTAWLALAMSSTLAGNFTLIGSVANLIMVQQARKRAAIGFMEYFRAGALITVITIATGILVLSATAGDPRGSPAVAAEAAPEARTIRVMPADTRDPARSFRVVLLCDTEAERIRGLQGFRVLAPREAALFIIDPSQPVSFWMADLSYGIDIIYVNEAGTVSEVHPELRPGSEEIFASSGPVRWVIETAAGSGVRPGDRIRIE